MSFSILANFMTMKMREVLHLLHHPPRVIVESLTKRGRRVGLAQSAGGRRPSAIEAAAQKIFQNIKKDKLLRRRKNANADIQS